MATIEPFRGVRYDAARVGTLASVLAPPYDVISPAEQQALHARSPWNVVRLILPREANRGAAAAQTLTAWTRDGVLARDPEPALYPYEQRFTLADGTAHRREGIICRLGLEEFSSGVVRPHERTFPGPKADRLALLRATEAYLSPVFGLYSRPGETLEALFGESRGAPLAAAPTEDGEVHRLWRVTDPAAIARAREALRDETIYIADGHHRYETALAWRAEGRGSGRQTILACLANMEQEGVVILPTHRLVPPDVTIEAATLATQLAECFTVGPMPEVGPRPIGTIDCVLPDRRLRLAPKPAAAACLVHLPEAVRDLDVALLDGLVLAPILRVPSDRLAFTHADGEAMAAVAEGRAAAAFLVGAPSLATVRRVCLAGELMPQKSTYFYPKLADGLVFDLLGARWA